MSDNLVENEAPVDSAMVEIHTIWTISLAFTLYAGWMDWQTRRIPNWLTVTGLCVGIAVNAALGGWHGVAAGALEGAGLALVLLLPLVLMRALGAGDWKLMGAIGALFGPRPFLFPFGRGNTRGGGDGRGAGDSCAASGRHVQEYVGAGAGILSRSGFGRILKFRSTTSRC